MSATGADDGDLYQHSGKSEHGKIDGFRCDRI